jgi:hypothetical protein
MGNEYDECDYPDFSNEAIVQLMNEKLSIFLSAAIYESKRLIDKTMFANAEHKPPKLGCEMLQ